MTISVNSVPINSFRFSGGEWQVSIADCPDWDRTVIEAPVFSADALLQLMLCSDALRRRHLGVFLELHLPYMPYARQDRVCQAGEALSLSVAAQLINSMEADEVHLYDPHSDVTSALINRCVVHTLAELVSTSPLGDTICQNQWTLISPDAGAEKKVHALGQELRPHGWTGTVVTASKHRDPATGAIHDTQLHGGVSGADVLIVDDICDGGRTFIELAKKLSEAGAQSICLYVTHGLFSQGLSVLQPHFAHIYCRHTMLDSTQLDPDFVTVLGPLQLSTPSQIA